MAQAKKKTPPLHADPAGYDVDFFQWCFEQAELLRRARFSELDLPNVIEELESMGNEQRHALSSSYRLVIAHLLKWQFQPERCSISWKVTIDRERFNIENRERVNRSPAGKADELVREAYRASVREAATETGLPPSTFPVECPYTVDQLRDPEYMPE